MLCIRIDISCIGATLITDGAVISADAAARAVLSNPQCFGNELEIDGCLNVTVLSQTIGDTNSLVGCPYAAVNCRTCKLVVVLHLIAEWEVLRLT